MKMFIIEDEQINSVNLEIVRANMQDFDCGDAIMEIVEKLEIGQSLDSSEHPEWDIDSFVITRVR